MATDTPNVRLVEAIESGRIEGVQGALRDLADAAQARKMVTIHVKLGVLSGALVDTQGCEPALALALRGARPEIVRAVLQAGADPNKPLAWRTPYWFDPWTKDKWPKRWGISPSFPSALDLALTSIRVTFNRRGGAVMVSQPIVARDACEDHLLTPSVDVIKVLVAHGAVVEDRHLEAARKLADREILEVLAEGKANPVKVAQRTAATPPPIWTSRVIAANMRDPNEYRPASPAAEANGYVNGAGPNGSLSRSNSIAGTPAGMTSSSSLSTLSRSSSINGVSSTSAPPAQHPLTPRVPIPTNMNFKPLPQQPPPVTSISSTDPDFLQRQLRDALGTIGRLRQELDALRDQNTMLTGMLREKDEQEQRRRMSPHRVVHDAVVDQRRSQDSGLGSPVDGAGSGTGKGFPFPGATSFSVSKASAPFATGATQAMTSGPAGADRRGWGTPGTPVQRKG